MVLNTARSGGSIKELFVLIADNTELMAVTADGGSDGGSDEKIFTFVISTEAVMAEEAGWEGCNPSRWNCWIRMGCGVDMG